MGSLASIFHWSVAGAYAGGLLYAAISDARSLVIPNWLCAAIAIAFLPAAWMTGLPWSELGQHYAIGGAFLLAGAVLFAMRVMGGGDVKLLAAMTPWLDYNLIGKFLILVALFGGALAIMVMLLRRVQAGSHIRTWFPWLGESASGPSQSIPYGVAIAAAGLWLLPQLSILPPH